MKTQNIRCHFLLALATLSIAPLLRTASAQYFGQNKVQYENFKFEILKTDHFDVYFYPEEKQAAQDAARMAERWYARHRLILQHELNGRQAIVLYASHPHFQQTNTITGNIGEGTGGVTEALRRRVVLPFAGPIGETDHVIGHELVHAFQYDITGVNTGGGFRSSAGLQLPLWFIEGMAEFLSLGSTDPLTAMWMRDAVKHEKKLPSLRDLEGGRFFPYRYGQALLAYVAGRWGDKAIGDLLKASTKPNDLDKAIRQVLAVGPDTLAKDWHQALRDTYTPLMSSTVAAETYGKEIISKKRGGSELNVGPVLSPDGKQLVFFSAKDLFAIDLFLADAETGKVTRNVVRTEVDPHFESLEFISSAGAWDANGTRLAFSSVVRGRPALSVLDLKRDKVVREIRLPSLGEIFTPSWSPDGQRVAFSALAGGMTDLFIYNLESDSLQRLTNDFYSDLQPAWSPDGKAIAFATDRFTADLATLAAGNYNLALYDVASGQISQVPGFSQGKHLNPQWTPDGRSLYFISDRDGISNIYRVELASGTLFQLTNLYTGVSGITASSPALTAALKADRISFSVYEDGNYSIYTADSPEVLAGKPVVAEPFASNPAALPPLVRASTTLDSVLANPTMGQAAAEHERLVPYSSKLHLAYVGQPTLVGGYDSYGTHLGAGISLLWTDELGNHNLGTVAQAQIGGKFRDFGGLLAYSNSSHRWNWGAGIQQVPYINSLVTASYGVINGQQVYVEQELRYRQLNQSASAGVAYPFNRAQRVEFSGGFTRISFKEQLRTQASDAFTGQKVVDQTEDLPTPSALNLGSASLALVYDTAIFGAASPLIGRSYRFEVSPTLGTIDFYTALADYRHYFLPLRPFTFAVRMLHYGRYGRDAEDSRFADLFLGYPNLVRGYDYNSFSASECDTSGNCPVFDQLFGSRLGVANFEVRFPLFGLFRAGGGYYGYLPIETGVFYDLGVAWTRAEEASFLGGDRHAVRSYGATARINLLGFAIFEVDYVKPVDRPRKGWFWQFNFQAGF